MIRKKFKKIIGVALALALASNSISYTAAIKSPGDEKDYSKLVQSIGEGVLKAPKSSTEALKISGDIDIESDEVISVIVEFITEPTVSSYKQKKSTFNLEKVKIDRDHRVFEEFISKMPSTYSTEGIVIKNSYTNVFNGVSLSIKSSDVEKLISSGVVKKIHKDYEVSVEQPVESNARATEIETSQIEPYMMDSVPYLGIDDLHEEGVKGDGIKVGVLDTGIDYNHPDLTSAYEGFRKSDGDPNNQNINDVKGWDFVDNDADPMETTYIDWQGSDEPEFSQSGGSYYTSHGTHVSGTIAGQKENTGTEIPVLGVAPNVDLYGYRVLGPYGSGATSGIIAAIEKAIEDGMDVINMSLGNSGVNNPFDPMVTAVNNATIAGVVTVISNGNSGPTGQTVGAPGTAPLPIAVGASTVDFNYDTYGLTLGEVGISGEVMVKDLENSFKDVENKELELVYCGLGSEADFEGKDVKGKVAVIDRGEIALVTKVENAKKNGALLAIMINNVEGRMSYLGEINAANTIALSKVDGEKLKGSLDKKLTITSTGSILIEGDEVTSFSSVGPVKQTFDIRPDIVAPGSQVFSTVPEYINDKNLEEDNYGIAYQRMSGTSMSAPHITGIAALILQANPEYTPEDVKAAMMNTSEHIHQKSGESYSVHEIGAGRVNPYKAVHEDVSFKANYKVFAGTQGYEYDNETGMLSYGKLNMPESGEATKTIPVTIANNTENNKTYTLDIEYSDSTRAANAQENNVIVDAPETVTVGAGESKVFDVTIKAPVEAAIGNYEGFIHFNETGSEEKSYQMPFGATVGKNGFGVLEYPSMDGGFGRGLTAFTSSELFNRNTNLYKVYTDINVTISVSEPIKYIQAFVKDNETGEYLGEATKQDATWIPEGVNITIDNIVPNGRVKKIVNGNVSHEEIPLASGIYELELVAEKADGTTFKESIPMGIINDISEDKVDFDKVPGIIEVTEDMYTTETWYDGLEHEGIWLNANVKNEIVEKVNLKMGENYFKQDELNTIFASGYYPNGKRIGMSTMALGDGDVRVAGVEREDLKDGFFRVSLDYANVGKVSGKPEDFILIKEDTKYLSLDVSNENINEEDILKTSISLNNSEDVVEGKFTIESRGDALLDINSVKATKELQELLDLNNNNVEIEINTVNNEETDVYEIKFKLIGEDLKGLNGDIKLFDINYSVEKFRGIDENLMNDSQFNYNTLKGLSGEFKNSKEEIVDIKTGTIYKNVDIEHKNRTLIYGDASNIIRGVKGSKIYAIDNNGNRYEPTYIKYNEVFDNGNRFTFNNLPVIEGDYKVIVETPGAFNGVMNVPGSKLNKDGEVIGNTFSINGESYLASTGILSVIGDTNGDGAIDVIDANEVAKLYKAEIPARSAENLITDFNQDGVVDRIDMEVILYSYLKQDFIREDSKTPEEIIDGKDIIDILESCGYFDETPEYNVVLNMDKESSLVGEEVNLVAVPPVDGIDFEYELSIREKGSKEWTLLQERTFNNKFKWISKKSGEYEFKLRIFLDEIEYVVQDNKLHTVKEIVISKIQNLDAEVNKDTVKLSWEAPKTTDGLAGYIIYKDGKEMATLDSSKTEYTAEDLKSNTIYGFKVVAKYSNGEVSKPVSENIRTKKK